MNQTLPLTTIQQLLGAEARYSDVAPTLVVQRIASLTKAGPTDMAVVLDRGSESVFDAVDTKAIEACAAGIILTQAAVVPGKPYVVVPDALAAFSILAAYLQGDYMPAADQEARIHPSAVVEQTAAVGNGTFVGAGVYVGHGCRVGKQVILHPGAKLLAGTIVGDRTIVHSNAVLGSDGFGYQVQRTGLRKIPHVGIVRVGNDVEIGACCQIDRAMFDETVLSDGVKLDNGVHVAHNVVIGPSSAVLAQTIIGGSVVVGAGCQIGGNVSIKDHVKIGNRARIVSTSAVMYDVPDGQTVAGIPAIPFGEWKRIAVCMSKLPEIVKLKEKFAHLLDAADAQNT